MGHLSADVATCAMALFAGIMVFATCRSLRKVGCLGLV